MIYFVHLKAGYYFFSVLCSQVKIPLFFFGGSWWGGCSIYSTSRWGRGSMILDGIRQGGEGFNKNTILDAKYGH